MKSIGVVGIVLGVIVVSVVLVVYFFHETEVPYGVCGRCDYRGTADYKSDRVVIRGLDEVEGLDGNSWKCEDIVKFSGVQVRRDGYAKVVDLEHIKGNVYQMNIDLEENDSVYIITEGKSSSCLGAINEATYMGYYKFL